MSVSEMIGLSTLKYTVQNIEPPHPSLPTPQIHHFHSLCQILLSPVKNGTPYYPLEFYKTRIITQSFLGPRPSWHPLLNLLINPVLHQDLPQRHDIRVAVHCCIHLRCRLILDRLSVPCKNLSRSREGKKVVTKSSRNTFQGASPPPSLQLPTSVQLDASNSMSFRSNGARDLRKPSSSYPGV